MYSLTLSSGCLTIRPGDTYACELWLDDTYISEFDSASAAAAMVASRNTGCREVDYEERSLPGSIDGWRWISLFEAEQPAQRVY
jgi:hypothetical protein